MSKHGDNIVKTKMSISIFSNNFAFIRIKSYENFTSIMHLFLVLEHGCSIITWLGKSLLIFKNSNTTASCII